MKSLLIDNIILNQVVNDVLLSNEFYKLDGTLNYKDSILYLKSKPASLYSKHDRTWLKIRYQVYFNANGGNLIPYCFHGYINENDEFVSRECHSIHHKVISMAITNLLNENRIGEIIKEITD